ncbi:MAG: ABC transporter substrate-binding protein [Propionibacteriaceae bacterium]|nr:ABC transporter substrate-binding protein [Propionibacteriaceae bacterium]
MSRTRLAAPVLVVAAALVLSACGGTSSGNQSTGPNTAQLVIDTTFDIKTIDPGRDFEPTGDIVVKALYDTLLTFADNDTTTVVPDLATYTANADQTEFTLTLVDGRVFSDGTPVTADDVVFSLNRLIGIAGNPSFLLDGVTVTKIDDKTVQLTTNAPEPALPSILASPPTGIVNSKVVEANGGTTDSSDGAENFLNSASAGSGPYMLQSMDITSQVTLVKNPDYTGPRTPTYNTVILRNVPASTQQMNLERGDSQVAMSLSGDQISSLASNIKVESVPSATTIYLMANADPGVNSYAANPQCLRAIREAIDYASLVDLAGAGAAQATGLIPIGFLGALPASDAPTFNLDAAKADATACGMAGQPITLSYPNDIDPTGVSLTNLAQRIQQQMQTAGITINLAPVPVATELDNYRAGKEEMGLWYWNPDYLDPADYFVFVPGGSVALRANWQAGADPAITALTEQITTTGDETTRQDLFEQWGRAMNTDSPFIPLIQPGLNVAHQPSVTNIYYNPLWFLDVAGIGAA